MKSKDLILKEKTVLAKALIDAMKGENEEAAAKAFADFAESVQEDILESAKMYQQTQDAAILASRGVRQLTAKETKFYTDLIGAMKSANVQASFTGIENALPETVIDNVLLDIRQSHPLLDAIRFQNTSALTKIVVNKQGVQLATWGALGSEISKELSGAVGIIDLTACKLSAYLPVAKDMLNVGPQWLDAYVRATLSEAIAGGLESAIVDGTGNNQPIGMTRDVSDGVQVSGGVYPQKEQVTVTELSPEGYGEIIATLATAPNGGTRPVGEVLLVCNPVDYFTKIMPCVTVRSADGTYVNNAFPYPTRVIQSAALEEGNAVFGLADRYFMGVGVGGAGGKIEYSDHYHWLEDERVYLTRLYGNGRPLDDNAFVFADISGLAPTIGHVIVDEVKGTVTTKAQA